MELEVENLGPITKGIIGLDKKLTILTGPNNTGKSYITYLLHAITQHEGLSGFHSFSNKITDLYEKSQPLRQAVENGDIIDIFSSVNKLLPEVSQLVRNNIRDNLSTVFASSTVKPVFNIKLNTLGKHHAEHVMKSLQIVDGNIVVIYFDESSSSELFQADSYDNLSKDIFRKTAQVLSLMTTVRLGVYLPRKTYFFPAERTAINLFAKHIVSTKASLTDELRAEVIAGLPIEKIASLLQEQVKSEPKYPYAIREYINFVNSFKKPREESDFAEIALIIENLITGGAFGIDEFDQIVFTPRNADSALELHLTSSLVKSLSYLVIYLKYIAKEGDLVIIDEPELNLHPNLQVSIARVIASMVNMGLKVVISTHSDYFIKELNNLILLNDLHATEEGQAFVHDKGYSEILLLHKEDVAAYYLNNNTIEQINIEEQGIAVPSINDTINDIDGLTQEILYHL